MVACAELPETQKLSKAKKPGKKKAKPPVVILNYCLESVKAWVHYKLITEINRKIV